MTPRVKKVAIRKVKSKVTTSKDLQDTPKINFTDGVLKLIFQQVLDLKEIKMVSKRFYKIASNLRPGESWMWIKNEFYIDDEEIFQSLSDTKRVINNFAIGASEKLHPVDCLDTNDEFMNEPWYFENVRSIVGISHGERVKQLQMMNLEISVNRLLQFLSYIPKLHTLKLICLNTESDKKAQKIAIPADPLPAVENVILIDCGPSVLKIFEVFPKNSIISFTVRAESFQTLSQSLQGQKRLKKLSLTCVQSKPIPEDLLMNKKLSSLTLNLASQVNLPKFIGRQSKLNYLDVSQMAVEDDTFLKVVKLHELQKLLINLNAVSLELLPSIALLKHLKTLMLSGCSRDHLNVLRDIKEFSLENFSFPSCNESDKKLVDEIKEKCQTKV